MRGPGRRAVGAAAWLAVLSACGGGHPEPDAVARIGSQVIRYPQFELYVRDNVGAGGAAAGLDGAVLSRLFDQFLDERLLVRHAVEQGLVTVGTKPRRAVEALLAGAGWVEAGAGEVAAHYLRHQADFQRPERVRLRQILVEERATADAARAAILAGEAFTVVARRLARSPGAQRGILGGEQGELARGDLPPEVAGVVFALAPGEVSEVVAADYGFHLFQVIERLPAAQVPLAEAETEVRARLRRERADRHLAAVVEEARNQYDLEVYARNLPFAYQGMYRRAVD